MDKEHIKYSLPQLSINLSTIKCNSDSVFRGPHFHTAVEIVYIHKGKLICHIDDMSVPLSENQTLLINRNVVHCIEGFSDAEFSYIQVELDSQYTAENKSDIYYILQFIEKTSPAQYHICNNGELCNIFKSISSEVLSNKPYSALYIKAYISQLFAFMHRYDLIKEFDLQFLNCLNPILPAIRFIDLHYSEKLYIDDIASYISCNKFRLCRLFKSITGGSVVNYINFVRLQHSIELLLNSDCTISEIAYSCGFASIQYFNKVFKLNFGCSPLNFKKTF